jgi:3-polyprenyl-4-hydroxybenzoate decarboxylase
LFLGLLVSLGYRVAVQKRLVVGISGGSGLAYAVDLLKTLQPLALEIHLVVTDGAKQVIPTDLSSKCKSQQCPS